MRTVLRPLIAVAALVAFAVPSLASAASTSTDASGWSIYHPSTITSGAGYIWVASSNFVTELSATTGALVRVISGSRYDFNGPSGMTSLGSRIWVTNQSGGVNKLGSVTEFSAATGALVRVINDHSFDFIGPFAITSDRTHVWVTGPNGNAVTEISASTGALVRVIRGSNYGFGGIYDITSDGTHVWVLSFNCAITELSATTGALVRVIKAPIKAPVWFYGCSTITTGAGRMWVTGGAFGNEVAELSLATGALVKVIDGSKGRRKNNFPLSGSQSPGADGVVAVGLGVVMADR